MPFQTIESLLVQRCTLVVANDNNYPFSNGRRPGSPDDNEIISVRLPRLPDAGRPRNAYEALLPAALRRVRSAC
jgi:hypothetical protein